MKRFSDVLACFSIALFFSAGFAAPAAWWEHAHDKWYLKDDWKAAEITRYSPTFTLESRATNGWIVLWGDQGVTLKVNGHEVMRHVDRGLIYDTNLTRLIAGAMEVKLECGPGRIVAEGELTDDQGRRYPFASGCDWKTPVAPGTRLPPAARPYRPGESSGAFNSAHNGLLMRYNEEERGKTEIAKGLARIQKVRDQSIFLLRRFRPPDAILSFSPDALWRRAENAAAGAITEAEPMLTEQAILAQKEGRYPEAIALAQKAGVLLASAELAVNSARELEELERQQQHVAACAELIEKFAGSDSKTPSPLTPLPSDGRGEPQSIEVQRQLQDALSALRVSRRDAAINDWVAMSKHNQAAHELLASLSNRLSKSWGAPVGKLDEFPEDRFGWLNAAALMGNDPSQWEFSTVNPAANWIDLRGSWLFRIDPPNEGEQSGWHLPRASAEGWRKIRVPSQWEREGVRDQNDYSPWDCPYKLTDLRCEDKPYNGYAWYRREVFVPKVWRGHKVVLQIGKVSHWLRVFLNGKTVGEPRRDGGAFVLPENDLAFDQRNSIAIQVYNHDNFGGIVGGPVSLSLDGYQPEQISTPGPLSFTTETSVATPAGVERMTTFASAMSPAVVLATDQRQLRLLGWRAKGFRPPKWVSLMTRSGWKQMELPGLSLAGTDLIASWLLLSPGPSARNSESELDAKPLLLVLEKRPRTLFCNIGQAGLELEFNFESEMGRILFLRLPDDSAPPDAASCRRWARQLRAVPVACSELARLDQKRLNGDFLLRYHYLEIPDFDGTPSERCAPLPQLLSYGLQHQFPGLKVPAFETSAYSSQAALFRFQAQTQTLAYTMPLVDKTKVPKGVGELFAKRQPQLNARGGNTEQQMFDDWKAWGFDHCRYAFAWGADWDLPLQNRMGGSLNDNPALWARLDDLVRQPTDRGLMAMLCYFFNEDSPQRDSKNLVRNSTRYWRQHPETRTNCYELWRRIAERYASWPEGLIAYDFFNEPAYMHQDDWNQIIKDLTKIVRAADSKHLIVCEAGDGWSQSEWFLWLQPTGDTNTLYSFHHYGKHWGYDYDEYYPGYKSTPEKQIDAILEAILFGIKNHVPLHCGEFGVSMISPGEDHLVWLDDYLALFERFGIGWNWWNWDGNGIYRTGLKAGDEVSPNLAILRKWIERKKGTQ